MSARPVESTGEKLSLIYGLEERLPFAAAAVVGVQQVASMVVGTITPALILSRGLNFSGETTAYLVSMALLSTAIGTWLQTKRLGPIGAGLLSVTGTSFSFIQPLLHAGKVGGLPLMLGMSLATAPVPIIFAPLVPHLRQIFTPLVTGVVVTLIGLSVVPQAMSGIVAAPVPGAPAWAGGLVAAVVVSAVLVAQTMRNRQLRLVGVLVGVAVGYGVSAAFGWLHLPGGSQHWLSLPRIFAEGVSFRWEFVLPFAFIYLALLVEAIGVMTATGQLSGLDTQSADFAGRLRGGLITDGLASLIAAAIGSFPSTTYAQNNAVIQITGVASRRVGNWIALILALLGLFPVVGRWVSAMPPSALGGLALLLFGLVAVSGLRLIFTRELSHRDALIVAISLGVGIGVPSRPEWLATLPTFFSTLMESSAPAGGLTALILNFVLPKPKQVVTITRNENPVVGRTGNEWTKR